MGIAKSALSCFKDNNFILALKNQRDDEILSSKMLLSITDTTNFVLVRDNYDAC